MKQNQRKRRYIDKEVQWALVRQTVGVWLSFLGGMFGLLFLAEWMLADPTVTLGSHFRTVWGRHGLIFLAVLAMLPSIVYHLIKVSHRFVGPVARVRGELQRFAAGEAVRPIQLRKKDFWQGLANDVNAALEAANARSTQGSAPKEWDVEDALNEDAPQLETAAV